MKKIRTIKLLIVLGTRPEALKLAPVIQAARKDPRYKLFVCLTGQHREMVEPILDLFQIIPDYDFQLMKTSQSLEEITTGVLSRMAILLKDLRPHVVMVQGDTTSAMSAALQAAYAGVPVAHVEAGLRSFNLKEPFPEELNRRLISHLTEYHFAPTPSARHNLLREGIAASQILVTGNTIIDALQQVAKSAAGKAAGPSRKTKRILVTAHRRENWGKPLQSICGALKKLAARHPDLEIIYPVHPNPRVSQTVFKELGEASAQIRLLPPMPYLEFLNCIRESTLILTDSGGVQEEAPSLGKPVLVLRRVSERMEGVKAGVAKLVGTSQEKIFKETSRLLEEPAYYRKMTQRCNPYGDGKASQRILNFLAQKISVENLNQNKSKNYESLDLRKFQENRAPILAQ